MRVTRFLLPLVLAATTGLAAQTAPTPRPTPRPGHRSPLRVLTFAAGGMLVGGWAGYVTAQIARSDWTDTAGRATQRLHFSLGGAALGLVAGIVLSTRGGWRPVAPQPPRLALPIDRPITAEEIRSSSARTITDLLRELRPQWLRIRGQDIVTAVDPNSGVHAANGVVVYLNGTPLGDLTTLDEVPIEEVTGIRFMDGPAAVLRYGTGNEDGAILLSTAAGP